MKSILDYQVNERKDVDFTQLVEYIYFKNQAKKKILIETSDLQNSKDIFCFCLDLFCKGLILCYGGETKRVEVNNLQMENIQDVIDKLSYTGIMTIVQIMGLQENNHELLKSPHDLLVKSVNDISQYPENDSLDKYNFKLQVKDMMYIIRFELRI